MNRITSLFSTKNKEVLNVYFTAGYPHLEDTVTVIRALENANVDLIELGIPYSDPLADGTTIQNSSSIALKNGMTLSILFDQVKKARTTQSIPIILMGYYNQMLQFGVERFLSLASSVGVDGLIIPDLPMNIYEQKYKLLFEKYNILISFLITPQTSDERIRKADKLSSAFLYMVSQSSITGKTKDISNDQLSYFQRIEQMNLSTPRLIGFGIHDHETYSNACRFSNGAIIGSEFIRQISKKESLNTIIPSFIQGIRGA